MPERPDLQAAVEKARLKHVGCTLDDDCDVPRLLARLEELEGEWSHMGVGARWFFRAEAAEADARAMREAIAAVWPWLSRLRGECIWCGAMTGHSARCPAFVLGAAALRGWYPGFYVQK